jgi:cell wall assembly regulator SMI1
MDYKKLALIVGIVAVLFAGLLGMGYLRFKKFEHSLYPVAPPMPAVVSLSADELLAQLQSQLQAKAPWILTNLQPGLSPDRINELERQSGLQIPDDVKALYHWRNGFNRKAYQVGGPSEMGPMPMCYFMPLDEALDAYKSFNQPPTNASAIQLGAYNMIAGFTKTWIVIFDDQSGNGYYFDPQRKPGEGAVFYHDMEDGQYVFFPSPKNLIAGLVKCYDQNAYTWKEGTNGASLDVDFNAAAKIWSQFGASASLATPTN